MDDGNYIERFNAEISNEREPESLFSAVNGKTNLAATLYELLLAGTDTTRTYMEWVITFMVAHPEVQARQNMMLYYVYLPNSKDKPLYTYIQEKMFQEVQRNIGDRFPSATDQVFRQL